MRRLLSLLILLTILGGSLVGCSGNAAHTEHELSMAPLSQMPAEVQTASTVTREAYQFAVANPAAMQQVPCYCGCGAMGHTSNYSCYVQSVDANGAITFDSHALGCSICVDITQDAMRFMREGKSLQDIRAYVDKTYSRYGPSNMP